MIYRQIGETVTPNPQGENICKIPQQNFRNKIYVLNAIEKIGQSSEGLEKNQK
jgi:hypothetical protein